MSFKIVILNANYTDYLFEEEIFAQLDGKVSVCDVGEELNAKIEATRDADAIMTRESTLPRQLIEQLQHCKIIVRYGVGIDNIDLDAAAERHIYVANVEGYGTDAVAEHTVALLFAVARRIVSRNKKVREGAWDIGANEPILSFRGKTLGVIGCGKIGRAFIEKTAGLGFGKVLGYDPWAEEVEGIYKTDLKTLLKNADFISLHLPLTNETHHLLGKDELNVIKKNAVIINTARGGLIDQDALTIALKEKRLFGAGLDVFEEEPPSLSHPLFTLDNVVVTDHTGWYSIQSMNNLHRGATEEVCRALRGEVPIFWKNRWDK